jgi:hypothetical protein
MEEEVKADPVKRPYRCRGQYEDLTKERKREVEELCNSEEFSHARFLLPQEVLQKFWTEFKAQLPDEMSYEKACETFCDLKNIIKTDRENLTQAGMTFEQLGDALQTIMKLAVHKSDVHFGGAMMFMMAKMTGAEVEMPKFETPIKEHIRGDPQWCDQGRFESTFEFNGQQLRVFVIFWGGAQICPFQPKEEQTKHYKGYHYGARDVVVTNLKNKKTLTYSTLLPHMIKHHGFLEGPFAFYRVNVQDVLQVLGHFEEGKSYKIEKHTDVKLRSIGSSGTGNHPHLNALKADGNMKLVHVRTHDIYITGDGKLSVTPVDNSESVTETKHLQLLRGLELEPEYLSEGWYGNFARQATKIYHWSDWLPEQEDSAPTGAGADASGPRVMMMGGGKVTDFGGRLLTKDDFAEDEDDHLFPANDEDDRQRTEN